MKSKPNKTTLLLALLLWVCTSIAQTAFGEKKALLVGINSYPAPTQSLMACRNDAQAMKELLMKQYEFPESGIRVINDAEATAANLSSAVKEHLIAGTKEGDVVVFFYAGHGTAVKDLDGDEKDGLDEVLQTVDFDATDDSTWFTDDLIFELFQRIPTRKVITIYDCCHSGTGNRGGSIPTKTVENGFRSRFSDAGYRTFELDYDEEFAASRNVRSVQSNPDHIFLAACQDKQLSWESIKGGKAHGIFTRALVDALQESPDMSLEALTDSVSKNIVKKTSNHPEVQKQEPNIELGSRGALALQAYVSEIFPGAPKKEVKPEGKEKESLKGEGIPNNRPLTLDDVAPGYVPKGNIGVVLETDKKTYEEGDLMEITLLTDSDCFAELWYYGVDDNVVRIFPNGKHADNKIKAAKNVTIPGDMDFRLRIALPKDWNAPFGNEVLKAVVSSLPFDDDIEDRKKELFKVVDGRKLNPAQDRLIEVIDADTPSFGEAMVIYRIGKKGRIGVEE